ncbi:PAS domain-containing sensor histidine kinase [Spirobacillus cienkowskii]|uniref:PAS domain-containing sensor histidine kinase n=1 Tax=Spirobacillus cienkowskii TaxID=495820 RepID=UPI0030CDCC89
MKDSFFFNNSKDILILLDKSGKILISNSAAKKYSLYEDKEIFPQLVPTEAAQLAATFDQLMKDSIQKTVLLELTGFPVITSRTRWKITYLQAEQAFAFCCEELTEFSAEDFLLHTGLMKTVFDHDPDLISIINRVGNFVFVNLAVYQFAGLSNPPLLIEKINSSIENKELWLPGYENIQKFREKENINIEATTDSMGNPVWFENNYIPLNLKYGENMTLVISKNITPWKKFEKNLIDAQNNLYFKHRFLFLDSMMLNKFEKHFNILSAEEQNFATKIKKVKHYLTEKYKTECFTSFNLKSIFSFILSSLNDPLNSYEIQVQENFENIENVEIQCFQYDLIQAFLNIFYNAINAIILSQKVSERMIKIQTDIQNGGVNILIINNGSVVKPEIQDKIFEPFITSLPSGHGTGLGLSIAKDIIENHNGTISFTSDADWTTFSITLPLQ